MSRTIIDIITHHRIQPPSKHSLSELKKSIRARQNPASATRQTTRRVDPARIRQARYDIDMSIAELAHELCITVDELQQWEAGTIAPTQGHVISLASYTHYPMLWFYGDESAESERHS